MHENTRKFFKKPQPYTKETYLQVLYITYSFQMWYYNKVLLTYPYPLEKLRKMQRKATIWITEAFCMSSIAGIKAIASLIPIYLYLQKLNR